MDRDALGGLARLVRYYILLMTTEAQSGHPTSSLSAADVMTDLFFKHLRFDLKDPQNPANDRVIFSKGHASPLVYALYAAAGVISEKELLTYRKFGSVLEGHPTPRFKYAQVATGSLGQGLSIGVGMALGIRELNPSKTPADAGALAGRQGLTLNSLPKVYVLMGDGETAEGSVWEAAEIASYYKLGNLVAIVDVNRLGQSTETMLGWDTDAYKRRFEAFGWEAQVVDGHDFSGVDNAFSKVADEGEKPKVIIAKTVKGKGVSFLEDKEGWHGKALSREDFEKVIRVWGGLTAIKKRSAPRNSEIELRTSPRSGLRPHQIEKGDSKRDTRGLRHVFDWQQSHPKYSLSVGYKIGEEVATRKAYGEALAQLAQQDPRIVALDGETSNSTFSELVRGSTPNQYLEMFIAEQNMTGVALGLSKMGFVPFASTFAAFWTRAHDQVRMGAYSQGNVKYVGSHSGVSIGEDGPSQMGLEDFAMFKSVFGSVVLCPSDAVSCARLVVEAADHLGIVYIRTARPATPVLYQVDDTFKIGGSKVVRESKSDKLTIVACGVCVIEALRAADELKSDDINVRVIDAYSIKPIDEETLKKCARETGNLVVTVEDHYFEGGLGDSVLNVFANANVHSRSVQGSGLAHSGSVPGGVQVFKLAVSKLPMSGKPAELLKYEGIDKDAIVGIVKKILGNFLTKEKRSNSAA